MSRARTSRRASRSTKTSQARRAIRTPVPTAGPAPRPSRKPTLHGMVDAALGLYLQAVGGVDGSAARGYHGNVHTLNDEGACTSTCPVPVDLMQLVGFVKAALDLDHGYRMAIAERDTVPDCDLCGEGAVHFDAVVSRKPHDDWCSRNFCEDCGGCDCGARCSCLADAPASGVA